MMVENLRHRTLDDLMELIAVRHAQRTIPDLSLLTRACPETRFLNC
jgi:hypothetical protein